MTRLALLAIVVALNVGVTAGSRPGWPIPRFGTEGEVAHLGRRAEQASLGTRPTEPDRHSASQALTPRGREERSWPFTS